MKKPHSKSPRVLLTDENKGFGGAERHVLTLAAELQTLGVLESLVARPKSWLAQNRGDLPFHPVGFRNEVDMLSVFSIYRRMKSSGANILHCIGHRDLVAAALARQLPGAAPAALVKAEHSYPDSNLSPLFRWAYGQCDAIAAVSSVLLETVKEAVKPSPNTKLVTVHNGISTSFELKEPEPLSGRPLKIGVLSPLRPGKGHSDFLEAAALLKQKENLNLLLSVAGAGELEEQLKSQARNLNIEVDFLGHVEDPAEFLRGLDLSVVPSHRETFSLVTLESMISGRALIAARSAGVEEVCQDYPTVFYPVGDVQALYQAMAEFCKDPSSAQKEALSAAVRARETFQSVRMAEAYQNLYQSLLDTSP